MQRKHNHPAQLMMYTTNRGERHAITVTPPPKPGNDSAAQPRTALLFVRSLTGARPNQGLTPATPSIGELRACGCKACGSTRGGASAAGSPAAAAAELSRLACTSSCSVAAPAGAEAAAGAAAGCSCCGALLLLLCLQRQSGALCCCG